MRLIPIEVEMVNDRMAFVAEETAVTIPIPMRGTALMVVRPAGIQNRAEIKPHQEKTKALSSSGSCSMSKRGRRNRNPVKKTTAVL